MRVGLGVRLYVSVMCVICRLPVWRDVSGFGVRVRCYIVCGVGSACRVRCEVICGVLEYG